MARRLPIFGWNLPPDPARGKTPSSRALSCACSSRAPGSAPTTTRCARRRLSWSARTTTSRASSSGCAHAATAGSTSCCSRRPTPRPTPRARRGRRARGRRRGRRGGGARRVRRRVRHDGAERGDRPRARRQGPRPPRARRRLARRPPAGEAAGGDPQEHAPRSVDEPIEHLVAQRRQEAAVAARAARPGAARVELLGPAPLAGGERRRRRRSGASRAAPLHARHGYAGVRGCSPSDADAGRARARPPAGRRAAVRARARARAYASERRRPHARARARAMAGRSAGRRDEPRAGRRAARVGEARARLPTAPRARAPRRPRAFASPRPLHDSGALLTRLRAGCTPPTRGRRARACPVVVVVPLRPRNPPSRLVSGRPRARVLERARRQGEHRLVRLLGAALPLDGRRRRLRGRRARVPRRRRRAARHAARGPARRVFVGPREPPPRARGHARPAACSPCGSRARPNSNDFAAADAGRRRRRSPRPTRTGAVLAAGPPRP